MTGDKFVATAAAVGAGVASIDVAESSSTPPSRLCDVAEGSVW